MKNSPSSSPLLPFSFSPFLLFTLSLIILLVACTPTQPGEQITPDTALEPTVADFTPTEVLPTDTLPAPTESPTEISTNTPEPVLPTDTPLPQPTETVSQLQIALINPASGILLWRESDQTLTPLIGTAGALDVRLSDDGTMLAYRKEIAIGQQELWVVNTDGTNARMLLSVDALLAFDPAALGVSVYNYEWIPGTHTLAFNTTQTIEGPGLFLYDDLHFLNADTGELTTQLTPGSGGHFVFSPDGLQYALIQPESISLLNTDGSNIRNDVLTYSYVLTYSEYEYYPEPIWSFDSTYLQVAIPPHASLEEPDAPTTLWYIPTDGSPASQLGAVVAQPFFIDPVRFSPDLSRIAYTRLPDPNDYVNAELVLANADGSGETVYATGNLFFIAWAPDSQHFVFENSELQETYLGVLGGDFSPLTDIPHVWDVTWLDATRFLFSNQTGTGWQMRLGTLGAGSTVILEQADRTPMFDFDN